MKKPVYPLTLFVAAGLSFSPYLYATPPSPEDADDPDTMCNNDDGTCKGCEPANTPVTSVMENGSLRYSMSQTDYAFYGGSVGCSPCDGSASNASTLPSLDLTRNTYISVTETFTSFGDRSGFARYDDVVIFAKNINTILFRSVGEQEIQGSAMEYNPATQLWERITAIGENFAGIALYKANGSQITLAA